MAEIRINTTGGLKLYDADNSHYAQIVAGTITSNVDAITLGHDTVTIADNLSLGSDSAILKLGADGDATLTHDGTTGLTIAATPISIDATGELHLNSTTGDIKLQDGGTDQIAFDLDGTAGEVIMKPAVDSDDLVISQYDGTEVIRIEDNASLGLVGNKLSIANSSSDVVIKPLTDAKDIIFQQYDGTVVATVEDNATFNIPASKLAIGGTAVTATAAELNLLDGGTSVGSSITLADADGLVVNDGGTMKTIPASDVKTYAGGGDLVFLHKLTMSSTSTASFNAGDNSSAVLFDGTYKYLMWIWTFNTSADAHVEFQFSTDGGSSYACTMHAASRVLAERDVGAGTQNTFASSAGTDSDTVSNATGFQKMTWYQTTDDAFQFHGKCELWNPQTSYPHFNVNAYYRSSGANIVNTLTHGMLSDADVDGFQIKPSTGNFASGEIAMYGFKRT